MTDTNRRQESPQVSEVTQDTLRKGINVEEDDDQGVAADKVTDKFSDNAGDNSLTRFEINRSIVSEETANEHSFAKALMKGVDNIGQNKKTNNNLN